MTQVTTPARPSTFFAIGQVMTNDKLPWLGNKPASESQIETFERQWAVRLPEDYRSFLQTYNGGRADSRLGQHRWLFPVYGGEGDPDSRQAMVREDAPEDLYNSVLRCATCVPHVFQPIGRDSKGNVFSLGMYRPEPQIYYCDVTRKEQRVIAATFADFFESLRSPV